jgi:hypothetical protein
VEPPDDDDPIEQDWNILRNNAEQVADDWAQRLGQQRNRRFHSQQETIPRHRSIVALHALLAHGWSTDRITTALTADAMDDVRTAAAVLEYRATELLKTAGIDATAFDLPPAMPPGDEWQHARQLLHAAEAHHLAETPTSDLATEHQELTRFLTTEDRERSEAGKRRDHTAARTLAAVRPAQTTHRNLQITRVRPGTNKTAITSAEVAVEQARQQIADRQHADELDTAWENALGADPSALEYLRARLNLVDAALGHQIDHAALALRQEPAPYLIGLLGHRPNDPHGASDWDQRAVTVEHYRHHILGLPYGQPAAPTSAPASEQALGTTPTDPTALTMYNRARAPQPTLDLGNTI